MVDEETKIIFSVLQEFLDVLIGKQKPKKTKIKKMKKRIRDRLQDQKFSIKSTDLAKLLIRYLINISRIENQEDLDDFVDKSGFLSHYLYIKDIGEYVDEKVDIDKDLIDKINKDDLKKDHEDFLKKEVVNEILQDKEEKIKKKVENRVKEDFRDEYEELSREKAALEEYRSAIDNYAKEADETLLRGIESIPMKAEYINSDFLWYEKLNLTQDPFPTLLGLSEFDKDIYDDIVVKTPIYSKFERYCSKKPTTLLKKSIIIYGEFGCGKTTFFDYLSYRLLKGNLFPIRIMLYAFSNLRNLTYDFHEQIIDSICDYLAKISTDPRSYLNDRDRNTIKLLFDDLLSYSNFLGIIIFIDGLHKSQDEENLPKKFLIEFQNFIEFFNNERIPIGIFIAGSNQWRNNIDYDPIFSGSVYSNEHMTDLRPRVAYKMLQKRFRIFSENESHEFFTYRDIELLYNTIRQTLNRKINFRNFIQEFKNRGFIVDNHIEFNYLIEDDVLRSVSEIINEKPDKFTILKNLAEQCQDDQEKIQRIISVISKVFEKIRYQDDPLVQNNQSIFGLLLKKQVLKKVKHNESKKIGFNLDPDLFLIFKKIQLRYKFNPEVYLNNIICRDQAKFESAEANKNIVTLERWKVTNPEYEDGLNKLLTLINNDFNPLINEIEKRPDFEIVEEEYRSITAMLSELLGEIYAISSEPDTPESDSHLFKIFRFTWLDNNELSYFLNMHDKISRRDYLSKQDRQQYLKSFQDAFESQIQKYGKHLRYNEILRIGSKKLNSSDKRSLNAARAFFSQRQYKRSIEEFASLLERKLRSYIHNIMEFRFGQTWPEKLPEDIKREINKEKVRERKNFGRNTTNPSPLHYLSRNSYKRVFNDKYLWEKTFKPLLGRTTQEMILKISYVALVQNFEKHERSDRALDDISITIKDQLHRSKSVVELMNYSYISLFEDMDNIYTDERDVYVLCNTKDFRKKNIVPIRFSQDDKQMVRNTLENHLRQKSKFRDRYIDVANRGKIQDLFNLYYPKVLGILLFLRKKNEISVKNYYGTFILFAFN